MKAKASIQNLKAYPTELFEEKGFLKLNGNESDFGCSPRVLEALKSTKVEDISYYPFYGELLEKLAQFHGIKSENIILTVGADEAICSILGTFLEVSKTVLTVTPSFIMPKIYAKIDYLNYTEIPYEEKWRFPKETFLKNIKKSDFIYLTTPNSPTGEVISRETIEKIVNCAENRPILIDETYGNYSNITNLDLAMEKDNIFIVHSFSKDFALAGLRLGYIISAKENIEALRKYLSPYNVSTLAVKAGIEAISDLDFLENVKTEIEKSKEILTEAFENLGGKVYNSKTNFLCVDFGEKADFIYKKLLNAKIKVKYFKNTPMLENCFRVTVPRVENARKLVEALKVKPTIVFDMDGVLVDATRSYRVAVQKTFSHFSGKDLSSAEISETKKLGGLNNDWDLTEFLLKKYNFNIKKNDIVNYFQEIYAKVADDEEILVTQDFFAKLEKDFNLAIFTGRVCEEAYHTLEKHGFENFFYPIITLKDVGLNRQKPDTYGIELIKKKVITDKIYYLGDTVDDMTCAKNSNVTGIGVLPPQDKSEELKNILMTQKPMTVLQNALELKNLIGEIYARN